MFDLQKFVVRYRLGLEDTESLIQAANNLLADGHTEPAIIELLLLESPIRSEAVPIFERVCAQLGVKIPGEHDAIEEKLCDLLEAIASGALSPRMGLELVMREVYWLHVSKLANKKYVGDSVGLEMLIGAYWGYNDLMERPQEISFAGKYGPEAIAAWEQYVRQQAKDWLEKHKRPAVQVKPESGDSLSDK